VPLGRAIEAKRNYFYDGENDRDRKAMTAIVVEVQGAGAIDAAEELLTIPGLTGTWEADSEVERGDPLTVIATIVGIVGGTIAIAEQIRKWYQEYRRSRSGKKIEKVLVVGRNGRRLLLENATIEQIQRILEE